MAGSTLARRAGKTTLVDQIEQARPQLARLGVRPDRFARILITEARRNPDLMRCEPVTVLGAAMLSAQLRLEPGAAEGHVWLIPRKRGSTLECQFMLGYRGHLVLAERAGWRITADVIRHGDEFRYEQQPEPQVWHTPAFPDRGDIIGAYAVAYPLAGGPKILAVLGRDDLEARRNQSDMGRKNKGPWQDHRAAMCRKSAIRALWPLLPVSSADMDRAAELDEVAVTPAQLLGDDQDDAGRVRETVEVTVVHDDGPDDKPEPEAHPDGTCDLPACGVCGGPLPDGDAPDGPDPTWADLLDDRDVDPPRFLAAARKIAARHGYPHVRTLADLDQLTDPEVVDDLRAALDRAAGDTPEPGTSERGTRNAEQPPLAPPPEEPS